MWNYPAIENLKKVCELAEELKQQGKPEADRAELLREIAKRMQPHIHKIGKPVKLKWGQGVDDTNFSFIPKTGEESSEDKLSSREGIELWSSYHCAGAPVGGYEVFVR